MEFYLVWGVLSVLLVIGSSFITYSVDRKFFKSKKKSTRGILAGVTFILSAAVVGVVLMIGTLMIFGR